jgi:hypothetical protein
VPLPVDTARSRLTWLLSAILIVVAPGFAVAQARPGAAVAELEAGPLYIFQNDGQYGENGTAYGAEEMGQQRNLVLARRAAIELRLGERHRLVFLYAPLDVTTFVQLERGIQFRDTFFPEGTLVAHRYRFDGYRASYLYGLLAGARTGLELGGSLQVRDAEVSFREQDGRRFDTENDIGLVFALKGRLRHALRPAGPWIMLEADGLSTFGLLGDEVSGAIYDARLVLGLPVAAAADLFFGARLLGGGADVERRFIENWGNYGSLALGLRLDLARLLTMR